jgi:hypothetical protein
MNAAKGQAEKGAASGDTQEAGRRAAAQHAAIKLVLGSGLVALTAQAFAQHNPFIDALAARSSAIQRLSGAGGDLEAVTSSFIAAAAAAPDGRAVYFWLPSAPAVGADWKAPPVYRQLTWAALAYAIFDTGYMLLHPLCTNKLPTLLPHHAATAALTIGALHFKVEPLTALCMIVELNTWLLTLKNLQRTPAASLGAVSDGIVALARFLFRAAKPAAEPCFLLSWVLLRLCFYPFLLLTFHRFFGHPCFGPYGYPAILGSVWS